MTNEEIKQDIEQITVHLNEIKKILEKLNAERRKVFAETYKFIPTPIVAECTAVDNFKPVIYMSEIKDMEDVLGELKTDGIGYRTGWVKLYTEINGVELRDYTKLVVHDAD